MKRMIIGLFALTSISAFAAPYDCNFNLVEGIDQEIPSMKDSVNLNPEFRGTDENRLKRAKKSVKIKLSEQDQERFKGQMAVTLWIDETSAVGPQQNEGFIAAMVSQGANVFQVSSSIKGTYYNLVCRKGSLSL